MEGMLRVLRILFMKKVVFLLFIGKCFVKFYDQREREMGTKYHLMNVFSRRMNSNSYFDVTRKC